VTQSRQAGRPSIGVVYLARCAEGVHAFRRFIDSYRRHPAGVDHDLIVVYKGFVQSSQLAQARLVFGDLPHTVVTVDDGGFDIGSHIAASRAVTHDYLCCLNTLTELTADGWLAMLYRHAAQERVGIAGAMGSYESLFDSQRLIYKTVWLCQHKDIAYDERLDRYFRFILDFESPRWCAKASSGAPARSPMRHAMSRLGSGLRRLGLEGRFAVAWWRLTRPAKPMAEYGRFPRFPNPHIRSNGFMIRRDRLRMFDAVPVRTETDACALESGADGLTSRIRRAGLAALVVGRDGTAFDVPDWWRSGTFGLEDQANLLLTDEQSRAFAALADGPRLTRQRMAWGDYLGAPPQDFPGLGLRFAKRAPARPVEP
jgi:hypothetical protein